MRLLHYVRNDGTNIMQTFLHLYCKRPRLIELNTKVGCLDMFIV